MIASGMTVSPKSRSDVVSRIRRSISASPVDPPPRESLNASATVSGVYALRRVLSIAAASMPSAR